MKKQLVVINLVPDGLDSDVSRELEALELPPSTVIPVDEKIREQDLKQKPLLAMLDSSKAVEAVTNLMNGLLVLAS